MTGRIVPRTRPLVAGDDVLTHPELVEPDNRTLGKAVASLLDLYPNARRYTVERGKVLAIVRVTWDDVEQTGPDSFDKVCDQAEACVVDHPGKGIGVYLTCELIYCPPQRVGFKQAAGRSRRVPVLTDAEVAFLQDQGPYPGDDAEKDPRDPLMTPGEREACKADLREKYRSGAAQTMGLCNPPPDSPPRGHWRAAAHATPCDSESNREAARLEELAALEARAAALREEHGKLIADRKYQDEVYDAAVQALTPDERWVLPYIDGRPGGIARSTDATRELVRACQGRLEVAGVHFHLRGVGYDRVQLTLGRWHGGPWRRITDLAESALRFAVHRAGPGLERDDAEVLAAGVKKPWAAVPDQGSDHAFATLGEALAYQVSRGCPGQANKK